MDSQTLLSAAVTIGVGALSGGITNAVAVWMLFHPHEPVRIWPFTFHGAIPKNKARLAKSVGKTVGQRLLTPEDLSRRLDDPTLRAGFDAAVGGALRNLLDREHGPLIESLGAEARAAVEAALPGFGARVADRLVQHLGSAAFEEQVARVLAGLKARVGDRPIGAVLGEPSRQALREAAERWVASVAEGEELALALRQVVAGELERMVTDDRPLVERLPAGMVAAIEQAIADSLPGIIERVGDALGRTDARQQVLGVIREGLNRATRDLMVHQRLLAKLVVTDGALEKLLDGFADQGATQLATELRGGPLQGRVRATVSEAVQAALRVPLGERLTRLGPERRAQLAQNFVDLLVHALRTDGARAVMVRALDRFLDEADRRTWGELLGALPPGQVARVLNDALSGEEGREWIADTVRQLALALLARPLGRPASWLGEDASEAIVRGVNGAAWRWMHDQIPVVVERLSVQEMVEQKVLGFSTQRMEEIVRTVTQRELDLIVNLGYLLGAIVGALAWGVGLLF